MKRSLLIAAFLLLASVLGSLALQTGYDQFQKALAKERGEGNLEEAIALYQKVIDGTKDESLAAKAQLRIGICYEKLGQGKAKLAQEAFQKVLDNYPEQSEAVMEAREKLSFLRKSRALMETGDKEFKIRQVWTGLKADLDGMVSPDGRYLSFVDWDTGDLAVRELATGTNRRLTNKGSWAQSPEFALFSKWSPDSRRVVYSWYNKDRTFELHIVDIREAKTRILFRAKSMWEYVEPFDWSPDGRQILTMFAEKSETAVGDKTSNQARVGLVSVEDGSVSILKTFEFGVYKAPYSFSFSPDGRTIAYDRPQAEDSNNRDIFLLSVDGTFEVPLVEHPALDHVLAWAPDGKSLLFASERTGSRGIWLIPVAGGRAQGPPQLIKQDIGPVEPLGITRQGAFFYGLSNRISDVYVADLDPTSGRILDPVKKAAITYEGSNHYPDYSADGTSLAYMSQRRNNFLGGGSRNFLCIHSLKTGKVRELAPDLPSFSYPRWSPDGRYVSVEAQDQSGRHGIFRVDAQTGEFVPLIQLDLQAVYYSHRWSNDGKSIIAVIGARNSETSYILTHNIETGDEKRLAGAPSDAKDIDISPDGKSLALLNREEKRVLRIMPVTGGEAREIHRFEQEGRDVIHPAWSADGRYIFLSKKRPGQEGMWDLFRVPAEGGEAQKIDLAMSRFEHFSVHPDGRHLAFSSGGAQPRFAEVWVMENFLPVEKKKAGD